ncbi:MAG: hypothetical protein RLZZ230_153 [Candidatus Parcubacteria bacterium]|jgi:two-component system phosphate regulon sensor histidine kinase PhoR
MSPLKRLNLYRWLERLLLLFLIIWVGIISVLYGQSLLDNYEIIAGGGVAVIVLILLLFIQQTLSEWLSVTLTQVDFSQDSAFTTLYDRSPVAYLTVDVGGKVIDYNPAAVKLLHTQVDTIQGLDFFVLIQSDEKTDASVLAGKIAAGITINDLEVPLENAVGEIVWVMMSVFIYHNATQRVISLVDITDQKHIDTAKSEFVALATHQLRTPIAAIRWNVELLRKNLLDVITPDRDRYLTKVERNILRMIDLINDFLSVSKLEMGTYATKVANVELSAFCTKILDEFTEKITEKNIQVTRTDITAPFNFKTDVGLLNIIVSNLISNAVKYLTPNGTLTLSYLQRGNVLEIIIADTGIGIPENEIDKLFIKFYRASNAQSHQAEGTGLGLYIVKQSAELLGGSIAVETAENKGAKFIVRLPVVE